MKTFKTALILLSTITFVSVGCKKKAEAPTFDYDAIAKSACNCADDVVAMTSELSELSKDAVTNADAISEISKKIESATAEMNNCMDDLKSKHEGMEEGMMSKAMEKLCPKTVEMTK